MISVPVEIVEALRTPSPDYSGMSAERIIETICKGYVEVTNKPITSHPRIEFEMLMVIEGVIRNEAYRRGGSITSDGDQWNKTYKSKEKLKDILRTLRFEWKSPGYCILGLSPALCQKLDESLGEWQCSLCKKRVIQAWHPKPQCDEEIARYVHEI